MKMKTSPTLSFLLLLLLGLSQAKAFLEDGAGEENQVDDIDIGSMILNINNGSSEMLLEGDLLMPKTRNAMYCWWGDRCRWRKDSEGHVTVPFTMSSEFSFYDKLRIEQALKFFHSRTCIRFVPHQNEADYISIENHGGCWSYMGRVGGKQVVSLARRGCVYHGIIQHEILHALGFHHEQNRSDRDQYVKINFKVIDPNNAYNFYKKQTNNLNTPYDYSSVMHYGRTAFSTQYGRDSIIPIPKDNVRIGQRYGMSDIDILRVNRLYEC